MNLQWVQRRKRLAAYKGEQARKAYNLGPITVPVVEGRSTLVKCQRCEHVSQGIGDYANKLPLHGTGWVTCPGSYERGNDVDA